MQALYGSIMQLRITKADTAFIYADSMHQFAKKSSDNNGIAQALNLKGVCSAALNKNTDALSYYRKSLKLYKELQDTNGIITETNNIAILYNINGKSNEALSIYAENRILSNKINDYSGLIASNINMTYLIENEFLDSANVLLNEALKISLEIGDVESQAFLYYVLGYYQYRKTNNDLGAENAVYLDSSLYFLNLSYKIYESFSNVQGMAFYYEGLAEIEWASGNPYESLKNIDKALSLVKKIRGKGIPGNNNGALFYWIPFEISTSQTSSLYYFKYFIYKQLDKKDKALEFFEYFQFLKDSVVKTSAKEELIKYEVDKAYEIKREVDRVNNDNRLKLKDQELKAQRRMEIGMLVVIFLVVGFLYFVFRQLKTTKAQKVEIEKKQKEISDSINYAKRIQDGMMTSSVYLKDILPKSFIFFQPKDVVSGDFYWVHQNSNQDIFFTVADCTGHGVPGAFMSMIGTSLLNELIIEKKIDSTDTILNEIRKQIIKSLKQNEPGAQKDGMDMALCKLNFAKKEVEFSGAYNPMLHISKNEIKLTRGDNQPIGLLYSDNKPFKKQTIKLDVGDMIYIFSDGFQDQFGGEKGKKYKTRNFFNFLNGISDLDVAKQHDLIKAEFNQWKSNEEQIDDVCIMGVRIL